ncbi:heme/hemin ABC transporter substrate-binding protein [Zunongwangia sp. HGR-M22]|uniref:heme/hemin ABC transporter substrate-binding protein n=1 Tax=Zunongwangia sp. HGR-M22 TaxID=3015168 RepID=UPI0022DD0B82|nr:ABC transporter substrate-binding protein [Zunongwangia sp. HGR-M22]WBL25891.1 ABC transporter substrate-binding protein [Zunongwangia sp. HGR-M22]
MKVFKLFSLLCFITIIGCKNSESDTTSSQKFQSEKSEERLISLNGTLSEIISDLGHQDQIVAVDVTSMYPENLKEKATDLGHVMNLNVEALLQQKPTQIFAVKKELSEDIISQLNDVEIPVHYYEPEYSVEGAEQLIKAVAKDLDTEAPKKLTKNIESNLNSLTAFSDTPKVMFIYARGAGTLLVAGKETPVAKMIELAGGENAMNSYDDYRPLTTEAVAQANPDVLLFFNTGLQSVNGVEGLKDIPGLVNSTAAQKGQVISMDGLLLTGFGPRTGEAAAELNTKLSQYAK